jgi:hypothetical protein
MRRRMLSQRAPARHSSATRVARYRRGVVLKKEMKDAIARSGYLMEQRLVPLVGSFGFKATPNERFRDPDTGQLRELDISAISAERIGKRGYEFVFPSLLIACKNLQCPLVFFTQREIRLHWFLGALQVSGLPLEIIAKGRPRQPLTEFLRLDRFHHYYRTGHIASQFCAVYEVKKQNRPLFEAGQTIAGRIDLFQDFDALAKAVVAEKREYGDSFRLDRRGEKLNLQIYYPCFVTSGLLVECFIGDRRPRYRRVHQVGYLLRTRIGSKRRDLRIDVVDEAGLRRLLATVCKEAGQIAERIHRRRRLIGESLAWITRRLARRKREHQAAYVSGELELE